MRTGSGPPRRACPQPSSGSMSRAASWRSESCGAPTRCSLPVSSTKRVARSQDPSRRQPSVLSACARWPSFRATRRSRRSSSARGATPPTSGSGYDASPALLASTPIVRWTRSHMTLSKWQALGNDYLLVERAELKQPLTPDRVRQLCDYHYGVGSDGLLEITSVDGTRAEVRIWNPDGSTAELSGNGVRIVAAWLARKSGAERVALTIGSREVEAVVDADGGIALDIGQVEVGDTETLDLGDEQVEFTP